MAAVAVTHGSGGADLHTYAAAIAGGLLSALIQIHADEAFRPPVLEVKHRGPCDLLAGSNTPTAENAPVLVDNHIFTGDIGGELIKRKGNRQMVHLQLVGQLLEFAVPALRAKHAVMVPFCKEILQNGSAAFSDIIIDGNHLHAVSDGGHAAGCELGRSIHFNDAHPAAPIV